MGETIMTETQSIPYALPANTPDYAAAAESICSEIDRRRDEIHCASEAIQVAQAAYHAAWNSWRAAATALERLKIAMRRAEESAGS
jgi:hypothetical protein